MFFKALKEWQTGLDDYEGKVSRGHGMDLRPVTRLPLMRGAGYQTGKTRDKRAAIEAGSTSATIDLKC